MVVALQSGVRGTRLDVYGAVYTGTPVVDERFCGRRPAATLYPRGGPEINEQHQPVPAPLFIRVGRLSLQSSTPVSCASRRGPLAACAPVSPIYGRHPLKAINLFSSDLMCDVYLYIYARACVCVWVCESSSVHARAYKDYLKERDTV